MSIHNKKYWLVIIIRKLSFFKILMLIFVVYGILNYSGFCFKEMRYISDEEKVRNAISASHIIRKNVDDDDWKPHDYTLEYFDEHHKAYRVKTYRKFIPYEDIDTFFRENPNCCIMNKPSGEDEPPSAWEKIFGTCNYIVNINYVEKYIEKQLKEPVNHGIDGWKQQRDKALEEVEGQYRERFVTNSVFTANNCGNFCRGDNNYPFALGLLFLFF